MKKILALLLASACAVAGWSAAAQAATATGTLNVQIAITSECQVNTSAGGTVANSLLDFGSKGVLNANVDAASAATGTGSVQVQCNNGTAYTIGLDAGVNPGTPGDVTTRRMKSGAEYVAYQLYQDAARTTVWGNTTGAGGNVVSKTSDGTLQSTQVFGRVPPQATPGVGTYTDTVAITVTYVTY